jgi:hypothetical protein
MRTTARLDDVLLREAKRAANETGRTLTQVIEDALRESLARRKGPKAIQKVVLPTFKGDGLMPGVDLDDLNDLANRPEAFGLADIVLSGFLRVVTHPKVFRTPTPLDTGLEFVGVLRSRPNAVIISPGPRHWDIFTTLSAEARVKGNLVPDAYLAALAIESGSEWLTADKGFARFSGLRWRHPFDQSV